MGELGLTFRGNRAELDGADCEYVGVFVYCHWGVVGREEGD